MTTRSTCDSHHNYPPFLSALRSSRPKMCPTNISCREAYTMRGSFDKPFSTSSSGERLCIFFCKSSDGERPQAQVKNSTSYGAMKCGQVTERFYYGSISLSCLLSSQGSQIFRDFTNAPSHPLSAYILTLHLSMPASDITSIRSARSSTIFSQRIRLPACGRGRAMPGQRSSKYMGSQLQYQHDQCLCKREWRPWL